MAEAPRSPSFPQPLRLLSRMLVPSATVIKDTKISSMRRLARELRRRDDLPSRDEAWLWCDLWGDILDDARAA